MQCDIVLTAPRHYTSTNSYSINKQLAPCARGLKKSLAPFQMK